MMNTQNPSFAQHQLPYGYAQSVGQPEAMAQFPSDFNQSQFQQSASFPNAATPQRPQQLAQQFRGQIPPHLYQQLQQQQQQQLQQQQNQQQPAFARPQSRDNLGVAQNQTPRQTPNNPHSRSQSTVSQGNAPNTPSSQSANMQQNMNMMQQTPTGVQMGQNSNAAQGARNASQASTGQMNPQAVAREEERVTTLLEINAHLIQEVTNLQAQGKAGSGGQQSPTSPTTDSTNPTANSPGDGTKKQPPSQEYADCMRRLQANLAYLAAIADASKKATGQRPAGPAIMIPPTHLTSVHPLYHKLKTLFPEAAQTTLNKAMAVANAQAARNAAAAGPAQTQNAG